MFVSQNLKVECCCDRCPEPILDCLSNKAIPTISDKVVSFHVISDRVVNTILKDNQNLELREFSFHTDETTAMA